MPLSIRYLFRLPILVTLFPILFALPATASRFAVGMQLESWKNVEIDVSKNPRHKTDMRGHPDFNHLEFEIDGLKNYYVEEPGFLFMVFAGKANNDAAKTNARNEAIQKGEHFYHWNYVQPPAIPDARWFRWGYTHGFASGGKRTFHDPAVSNGKDTTYSFFDKGLRLDYIRFDGNMITAPSLIGNTDFYWMVGSDLSYTSIKIYAKDLKPDNDGSFLTMPLNLHMGWQPKFFPFLMLEGNAGLDVIDPVALFFTGFKNYTPYSEFGMRASLGTDWITCYYDLSHQVDPIWDFDEYNRRYTGIWSVIGIRLDIGNLIMRTFK
jgi:hypothetical protein